MAKTQQRLAAGSVRGRDQATDLGRADIDDADHAWNCPVLFEPAHAIPAYSKDRMPGARAAGVVAG